MLFAYLSNWSLGVVMISIATHNLLIVVGFGMCTGPQLLEVILQHLMLWPKGQPIFYDQAHTTSAGTNRAFVYPTQKFILHLLCALTCGQSQSHILALMIESNKICY